MHMCLMSNHTCIQMDEMPQAWSEHGGHRKGGE